MSYPISLSSISKFEIINKISINVYSYNKDKSVFPVYLTKNVQEKHVHLLLVKEKDDDDDIENETSNSEDINDDDENVLNSPIHINSHYCWIKNLSALISSQLSKSHLKKLFCDRCLLYFNNQSKLEEHIKHCKNDAKIVLPIEKNKWLEFTNYKNQQKVPFVIYADIESILEPVTLNNGASNTARYQNHHASSIGLYFKCSYDDSLSFYWSNRSSDCIQLFCRKLKDIGENIYDIFNNIVPMNLSSDEEISFQKSTFFYICSKPFTPLDYPVRDHCHFTGKFRGSAYNSCNLNFKESRLVPVVFHNLSGYDSHFIIEEISRSFEGDISAIPISTEKYISFTKILQKIKITNKTCSSGS